MKNSVVAAVEIIVALEEAGLQLLKDTGTATCTCARERVCVFMYKCVLGGLEL